MRSGSAENCFLQYCKIFKWNDYNKAISLTRLAASYAFDIAKNHPLIDGNKRTTLMVCLSFLRLNSWDIHSTQEENYLTFYALAEGALTEEQLGDWLESKAYMPAS